MRYLGLFVLLMTFSSCKDTGKTNPKNSEIAIHPGKKLIEAECYICHNPKASEAQMIAPPMVAVKRHYIDSNTTKEQFITDLIAWINNPEQESKMPGALQKFGNMPYVPYPNETIRQIAEYIYDYDIEKPEWFEAHYAQRHGKGSDGHKGKKSIEIQSGMADQGMAYALAAKAALGKNLIKAIQEKGTVGAIEFCNDKAKVLTDSVSVVKDAIIKRVSDKPRNIRNKANEAEMGYISYFKKLVASETPPKPIVKNENGEVWFYYPITTNMMCLQCHGKPDEQVMPTTLSKLRELYPADQALGYDVNQVRGIWAINFETSSLK